MSVHLGDPADEFANDALTRANMAFAAAHPGDGPSRQPVHTLITGAHQYQEALARKLGDQALAVIERDAPDATTFAHVLGLDESTARELRERVIARLGQEPVEDLRIDFEDGYGHRGDAAEDAEVERVARVIAADMANGTLPPFIGVRVKALNEELRARSMRTTQQVIAKILQHAGQLPANFVVTIPKVTVIEQVHAAVSMFEQLEIQHGLPYGTLQFEIMVETPALIIDHTGSSLLARVPAAARGRLRGAHFGTYDYTAGVGITAAHQRLRHPACDFAKSAMQVALAGTGVWLTDGSTSLIPIGDRAGVHRGWRMHFDDVLHSLSGGFYQGYDLHAAQLVTRYAALYSFFLDGLEPAGARLRKLTGVAEQASQSGAIFDEPATGQGLLNFLLRAVNCGAVDWGEAQRLSGLTAEEMQGRSFVEVLENRNSKR